MADPIAPRPSPFALQKNSVSGFVLERQFQLHAIEFHFAVVDADVLLDNLSNAQITQSLGRALDGCARGFLPRLGACPDKLDDLVNTLCHLIPPSLESAKRQLRLESLHPWFMTD